VGYSNLKDEKMKLSIHNFKTIRELNSLNFDSINIISGINSSGKTSFIQFLLLLKQTLEALSANPALIFDGNWVKLGNAENLVYKKDKENSIGFELQFDKEHIKDIFPEILEIEQINIRTTYSFFKNELQLAVVNIQYIAKNRNHAISFYRNENGTYNVNSDTQLFVGEKIVEILGDSGELNFVSFFPLMFTTNDTDTNSRNSYEIKTKEVQNIIQEVFSEISYIGPLREKPQDSYESTTNKNKYIGSKGEFAAQFLEEEANNIVEFYDIESKTFKSTTLSNAVKYWICDYFRLAKDITAEKDNDRFKVKVINQYNVESTIRQVGFGISQVLPIIVEGLRMPKDGILILEQPEIHLHPKVQSMLFDFVYSLSLTGKKFIIETHSDHFITRMRRRVAEDNHNLADKINLVFVEQREAEHLFHKLNLDEMGTFDYFPNDFLEQTDDLGAIIMAQAKKAKTKQN